MFIVVNSTPIDFKKIFFDKFCPHMLHDIAAYVDYFTFKDGSTVRYASIFAKKYDTQVRYAFFVRVRLQNAFFAKVLVLYVGKLVEFKTPDFSHIAPAFCVQRQKAAETNAKCVN